MQVRLVEKVEIPSKQHHVFLWLSFKQYMVAIPAVLEAGAETKVCASLLQPNETLVMSVTLMSQEQNIALLKETSSIEFHTCTQFKAPLVQNEVVQKLEVEVQGDNFYSKEVRKVVIKVYQPMTFVQTDKPIYLPGQTGNSLIHQKTLRLTV
ncbi:ovostatin homolog 2-like [Siniperca chuatsi]|uniref:ovostatin homolog 2-like n=1 Tax=Siniperca chuatsi TaxID=119488 RepID=UPI001CE13B1E|nr:ovostatin homolog 2-like [Siniperca chuatsi]